MRVAALPSPPDPVRMSPFNFFSRQADRNAARYMVRMFVRMPTAAR